MEKHYSRIAKKVDVPSDGVHLVHYVMTNMNSTCIFPPSVVKNNSNLFTPQNICSAILAYVRKQHKDENWDSLERFGITTSAQVGSIVKEIQSNWRTRVFKGTEINESEYTGLFSPNNGVDGLAQVTWLDDELEDQFAPVQETYMHLNRHFPGVRSDDLVVRKRTFPEHVRADVQLALEDIFKKYPNFELYGVEGDSHNEALDFQDLLRTCEYRRCKIAPLNFEEVSIGPEEKVRCQSNGLWLVTEGKMRFVVVLGTLAHYRQSGVQIEIATKKDDLSLQFVDQFFEELKVAVERSRCYRGKILSFENSDRYDGFSSKIKVHQLKKVTRDEVILPPETVDLLDRNIVDFVRKRPELRKRGMNLKKGLLFFGPPGTGKTHTVHYLCRALPETTSLIITSEQIGQLSTYMTLARLLQPSLVIIEDADLIARQREEMGTCEEVLLNKLLNEMDGLRADSEIIFVLTTNRPETLEAALTARPGRIDQAIEFPLPNQEGRQKLAKLYAGSQALAESVVETIVAKTENTSAAFIKELMRRATQYAIDRGVDQPISESDVTTAVEEMLFSGNAFNRLILGAASDEIAKHEG